MEDNFSLIEAHEVAGWNDARADINTTDWHSEGGATLQGESGYSMTQDAGNYGWYGFQFKFVLDQEFFIDMTLSIDRPGGTEGFGLWNVVQSSEELDNFGSLSSSTAQTVWQIRVPMNQVPYQVLPGSQEPGNCRIRFVHTFRLHKARSVRIGAIDQNNGKVALKVNSILF